jgi:hypothetical protein
VFLCHPNGESIGDVQVFLDGLHMRFDKASSARVLRVSLWLFVLAVYGFSNVRFGLSIPANGSINIAYSDRAPTIDGVWDNSSEWSDTTLIKLTENMSNGVNMTADVRLKYNGTYVFVLIDFLTDLVHNTYDQGGVCIDSANDGGSLPQADDYLFSLLAGQAPTFLYTFTGTGSGSKPADAWSLTMIPEADGASGFARGQFGNDSIHLIYEFQIPCMIWPAKSSYGFYVYVFDYHTQAFLEWPVGAGGGWTLLAKGASQYVPPSPDRWGSINGEFIPELSLGLVFVGLAAASTSVSVIFRWTKVRKTRKYSDSAGVVF